jgi:hypothetical protein
MYFILRISRRLFKSAPAGMTCMWNQVHPDNALASTGFYRYKTKLYIKMADVFTSLHVVDAIFKLQEERNNDENFMFGTFSPGPLQQREHRG